MAIAWRLQWRSPAATVYHYDCTMVASVVASTSSCKAHEQVAHALSTLASWEGALGRYPRPEQRHVKSHTGQPWNELADWAASRHSAVWAAARSPFHHAWGDGMLQVSLAAVCMDPAVAPSPPCEVDGELVVSPMAPPFCRLSLPWWRRSSGQPTAPLRCGASRWRWPMSARSTPHPSGTWRRRTYSRPTI